MTATPLCAGAAGMVAEETQYPVDEAVGRELRMGGG